MKLGWILCFTLAACSGTTAPSDGGTTNEHDAAGNPGADGAIPQGGSDGAIALSGSLPFLPGVNLSGAEFGSSVIPGKYGTNYTLPSTDEADYFLGKGMKLVRLPFLWERLQPTLDGELDAALLGHIHDFVSHVTGAGGYVLLDPHNYARRDGKVIGSSGAATAAQFGTFWAKLASEFKDDDHVLFGLMNEPHGMDTNLWLTDANAAIAAIRDAGATNYITVPGNDWTGAHSWVSGGSGDVMINVVDPLERYVFEVHQYFDSDNSGTHDDCTSATVGADRVQAFTKWAKDHHVRALIGEFGAASNATCDSAIGSMLDTVDANRDVYVGWTYWSAGPWWGDYSYSLEPASGQDKPQLAVLSPHF